MVITLTILPVGLPANLTSPRMISSANHAHTKGGRPRNQYIRNDRTLERNDKSGRDFPVTWVRLS